MKRFVASFFALLMMLSCIATANADEKKTTNRFNVVFVTDNSGSMKGTDPQNYRFEAIDLFIGLLAKGGNRVGSVVFNSGVVSTTELTEITGNAEKRAISGNIRKQSANGWTDIGGGILTAVRMVEKDANQSLPSIIVLLTDGNTEMKTREEQERSLQDKETAMEIARNSGIKIFTISLNTNNTSNTNELKQIAEATNGEFREVTSAQDLQDVFDLYYRTIYSTQNLKVIDEEVPGTGCITANFPVADLGVEEVNIVVFGESQNCELTDPNLQTIPKNALDDMTYKANTFYIIKMENPIQGNWKIAIEAKPGSIIKIFKIYNLNLQVALSLDDGEKSLLKDNPISINAKLLENGKPVNNLARYTGYTATMTVCDYQNNVIFKESREGNNLDEKGYAFSFTPSDYGTYYASVSIKSNELFADSNTISLNIGNTPPAVASDPISKHIYRWPFLIPTDATINLAPGATDAEDKNLTYKVKSASWMDEDYTLDGEKLTIENFSVSKGSFEIQACDSLGAYCTFHVNVTSTNVAAVVTVAIITGGLLALAIMAIIIWRLSQKAFMGSIRVENIESGKCETRTPGRGKIFVSAFQVGQTGLDKKVHFQASGKNYIYLNSSVPVYNDYTCQKMKKVRIDSDVEIRVSTDDDCEEGIIVYFESYLNN